MTVESTKQIVSRYIESNHMEISALANDVVFKQMASGEEYHGPEAVQEMLNYTYHIAFDARAETTNMIFGENKAVLEADFVGRHIGDFAGIAATNKDVRVPLCVVYDLEDNKITQGRIYFEIPVLMAQLQQDTKV